MGTLYLVRHGQASFGAEDYDQLSALGRQQAVRLGEHWRTRGLGFDAVITGTLRRHTQTLEGIAEGPDAAKLFQPDRIHPTAQAHPRMLDNVWPALKGLLR